MTGVDGLDGTPVLDIKLYLPYADSIPEASAGWAAEPGSTQRHGKSSSPNTPCTPSQNAELKKGISSAKLQESDCRDAFARSRAPRFRSDGLPPESNAALLHPLRVAFPAFV